MLIFFYSMVDLGFAQPSPLSQHQTGTHNRQNQQTPNQTVQMTDIHDIKPPIPPRFNPIILYGALAGITLVIGILLLWYVWKKRKKKFIQQELVRLSPEEVAFQSLDDIMDIEFQEGKLFYFKLSAILRQYIEGRFGFNALEMTTEELLPKIEELNIPRELKQGVKELCKSADTIKFAGLPAIQSKMQEDWNFVRKFVIQTTEKKETPSVN